MSIDNQPINSVKKLPLFFRLLSFVFITYFVAVLLLMFIGQLFWGFSYDHQQAPLNLVLLPFVLALLGCLIWLAQRDAKSEGRLSPLKRLALFQICFFAFQFCWVYTTRFYPICESSETYAGAYALATGASVPNMEFFRIYPHNAPNALLTSYIIRLALLLGFGDPQIFFPYVGALLLNVSTGLLAVVVYRLTKRTSILWITAWVGAVWIGISQFMMIPYSDIYSVLFPVLALWVLTGKHTGFIKWFWFSLICFFGYAIRPTILILWIAAVIYSVSLAISRKISIGSFLKKTILIAAALIISFLPASLWKSTAITALAGSKNPQEACTVTHYLMMGANYKTLGEFSPRDFQFSQSFPTIKERQSANLQEIEKRLSSMSPRQFAKLALIKLYKPHADGNFFADCAYVDYLPPRTDPFSAFFRDIYLKGGAYHLYYVSLQQIIWLAVLLLAAVSVLATKDQPLIIFILGLAVVGMAAYNLLGENWPRYLFVFSPLYLVMAMLGLNAVTKRLNCKKKIKNTLRSDRI